MDLHELDLTEARETLRSGAASVEDLVRACLHRIAATDDVVKAWVRVDAEGALAAARQLDRDRAEARERPLFGIPVGVKDVIDVQGLPTGAGFGPLRDIPAAKDALAVQQLRSAGAVILGKTATTQFALGQDSPGTRNPWNLEHTPGGSSIGSAAAVAARQIPMALGTQTTGSLLRPAGYCGLSAVKPTFGRVSVEGVHPTSWGSDHVGVMARAIEDLEVVLEQLRWDAPRSPDLTGTPAPVTAGRGPHLRLVIDLLDGAEPEIRTATEEALAALTGAGARVTEVKLPVEAELLLAVHWYLLASDAAAIHSDRFEALRDGYLPSISAILEIGQVLSASTYVQASRLKRRWRSAMDSLLGPEEGFSPLIAPTAPDRPPRLEPPRARNPLGDPSFQALWTMFGYPTVCLPTSLDGNGIPNSIQVIGPLGSDRALLRVSKWCAVRFPMLPWPLAGRV